VFEDPAGPLRIVALRGRALSVPLREPFVIASGRLDATRSVEVEAAIEWRGRRCQGLGEAACLPPVTREDQADVIAAVAAAGSSLVGATLDARADALDEALGGVFAGSPVARAGVESAVLDAMARAVDRPLRTALGGALGHATEALETDVTIAIAPPETMAALASAWMGRGFRALKVKIGRDVDADLRSLEAIARAAPQATLRVDANAGYTAAEALEVVAACRRLAIPIECWEQPCAEADWDGMARVCEACAVPVIADESVRGPRDLDEVLRRRCATGVNLKLAKLGGIIAARRIGAAARQAGLCLMMGGMVETRLGMAAAAHVACSLGGAEFVDLDTAWLLVEDPYEGGYTARGPVYSMPSAPGIGVSRRPVL
jgi:L-Ala-D/L-Glu epimerase